MARSLGRWVLALDGSTIPDKALIGGKAWSIARMGTLGLTVPPAIVVTTEACRAYLGDGVWPEGLAADIEAGMAWLEEKTGKRFGHGPDPLLVSVRSGAPVSMPGMMDTILNLGINDDTEKVLADLCQDEKFARDTHRRFIDLYATVVMKAVFEPLNPDHAPSQWRDVVARACGFEISSSLEDHIRHSIQAVFDSWNTRRAKRYREHHNIPNELGTAVTIQAMVFGNMDDTSGTGVLFSRNPLTGDRKPYGEYLARAQGEDVVSGKFTPQPLDTMKQSAPVAYTELLAASATLEMENGDVQDIEFTVEKGKLYLLQSRAAKRSPYAAARIAVDLTLEGKIDQAEALRRITPEQARIFLSPRLSPEVLENAEVLARGEAASPGVGMGTVVGNSDEAESRAGQQEAVVLVRKTTSPDDVHGMISARAIATELGGATSHAAVVSRALGRPCVVGCGEGSLEALVGKKVTIDGSSGKIFAGELEAVVPDEHDDEMLSRLVQWASELAPIQVSAQAPEGVDVVNLDGIDGIEDVERHREIIGGLEGVRAVSLSTALDDAGVVAAIDAGIEYIVVNPTLPVLLSAVHARQDAETPRVEVDK